VINPSNPFIENRKVGTRGYWMPEIFEDENINAI
jgi:hypothetical protein